MPLLGGQQSGEGLVETDGLREPRSGARASPARARRRASPSGGNYRLRAFRRRAWYRAVGRIWPRTGNAGGFQPDRSRSACVDCEQPPVPRAAARTPDRRPERCLAPARSCWRAPHRADRNSLRARRHVPARASPSAAWAALPVGAPSRLPASRSRTRLITICGSNGLTSTPSQPTARARASSIGSNAPVSSSTGMCASSDRL